MKYKNSFFKIRIKEDGTYLDVFPPKEDGKRLDIREVVSFLEQKGFAGFSIDALRKTLDLLQEKPLQIKISDTCAKAFDESATIITGKDNMIAYIRFYPPSTGGKLMTGREIRAELEREKILYGILEPVMEKLKTTRTYCTNIPIAKGMAPMPAKDTVIEYFFNTKPLAKPKVLEDGSVDFHALNITLSEDGTLLTSNVNGNVTLAEGTVFVSDTYKVAADVDASTGDIEYEGNVMVPGTVRTGFTIRAKGDIEINGVVEGATLIAGGNIVIKRGVQGMGKGKLCAGGDICAQFFESANVFADGDVLAGSILHSHIQSGGKVVIHGRKGFIVGGELICETYVEANSIGNRMETQTIVKVGVKPELYEQTKALVPQVMDLKTAIEETTSYLNVYKEKLKRGIKLTPENVKQIKTYTERAEEMKAEYQQKNDTLQELRIQLTMGKKGSVKVLGNAYRGVMIYISNQS